MPSKELVGVRVTPTTKEKLTNIAMNEGRSVSNLVEQWVKKEIQKIERTAR